MHFNKQSYGWLMGMNGLVLVHNTKLTIKLSVGWTVCSCLLGFINTVDVNSILMSFPNESLLFFSAQYASTASMLFDYTTLFEYY